MTEIIKRSGGAAGAEPSGAAGGKIVEREVIAASAEAARILDAARAEAAQVVASAEQARDRAVEEGYQEGYARGFSDWLRAVQSARDSLASAVEHAKPQIVRMALRVAEKILRQKLDVQPAAVLPMIEEALRSLHAQQPMRIVLRIHPADEPVLQQRRERWLERFPFIASIHVVADESLQRGGCRIESDYGMVDATLQTQIRAIERHLLGGGARE